jgi:hypothetical protein
MSAPPKASKLPLHFDPPGLQADLSALGGGEWTAHFNTGYFTGDWSGAALRSVAGNDKAIYADNNHGDFADTALLQQCQHLRAVVETFQCPLRSVRLLRLTAGSIIREHRDYDLGYEAGEVRIHVPVITNPSVEFYLNNRRIVMAEGECWYLDLNLPHRVLNLGNTDRVHLVIDCQLNDWLRDLIAKGTPCAGTESGLELFRRHVLSHPELQQQLMDLKGREAFIARNVELGREHGFTFHPTDVEAALLSARRAWMERWIV